MTVLLFVKQCQFTLLIGNERASGYRHHDSADGILSTKIQGQQAYRHCSPQYSREGRTSDGVLMQSTSTKAIDLTLSVTHGNNLIIHLEVVIETILSVKFMEK
jgi:hypothetical protein